MAEALRLREAARLTGVSPGRLYRAIADGRLAAAPGEGPDKPTLVSLDALQTFCRSEGLCVPDAAQILERSVHSERSGRSEHAKRSMDMPQDLEALAGQYLARIMERQSNYFDLFLKEELSHLVERVVDQMTEHLTERLSTSASIHDERAERSRPALAAPKAEVLKRLRAM